MSEILERKVIGALLGFRNGTKTASEVYTQLNAFKAVNPSLAADYERKFVDAAKAKAEKK